MAVNLGEFHVDAGSVEDLLTDPDGPVGQLIFELSEQAATVARSTVHVRPGTPLSTVWNEATSSALPKEAMRDSIDVHLPRRGSRGGMYGGVNVVYHAVFLEKRPKGSSQMYDRYPFMTTGLESLEGMV